MDVEVPGPTGGLDVGLKERETEWQLLASAAPTTELGKMK